MQEVIPASYICAFLLFILTLIGTGIMTILFYRLCKYEEFLDIERQKVKDANSKIEYKEVV